MSERLEKQSKIGMSLLGIVVSIVVFTVVWVIGGLVFGMFDSLRGLGDDRLQAVFREIVVPGAAGFFAMFVVSRWFEQASMRIVFFGFSGALFVLIGIYVGVVTPYAEEIGGVWTMLLSLLSLAAGIVGAYINVKDKF